MTTPTYDQASPSSIEWFGRRLIGKTLRNTPGAKDIPQEYMDVTPGVQTKGHFGTIVERYYYGINPGNQPCSPDFKEAGVELKTNALIKRRKGISAKERLVLQMISYDDIIHESFESSCFMAQSRLMMLISNKFNPAISMVDTAIVLARLVDFNQLPLTDQQIIREDWTKIAEKVRRGQAHKLSGSDTIYLEACTKGSDGSRRVSQPISDDLAKPRAFALKSGFVTSLVRRYLKDDFGYFEDDEQTALADASEVETKGFEAAILQRFDEFLGLTVAEIATKIGLSFNKSLKGYRATLTRAMLGVTKRKIAEFERAGIELKTIRVRENGSPREHMSFPCFKYTGDGSILEENWDAVDSIDDDSEEDIGES